jgi:serine/threonine-protein kinase
VSQGRRYEILSPVGTGGFGTVYRARLLGPGGFSKLVALKVANTHTAGDPELLRRLRDEARVLGLVNHRAIIGVDALVELEGSWTVVMEYVEGIDLVRLVSRGPLPPSVAVEVVGEVADALHVAYNTRGPEGHRLRLIHRDIKLGNVLITEVGEVKVLDFGIARATFQERESDTQSTSFGSLGYMSPERLDGIDGPGGDVYALGVVLAEMLTGAHVGRTSANVERHQERLDSVVARVRDAVGRDDLAALIESALAYDPEHRPVARKLGKHCADLRATLPGGRLREWAEHVVPEMLLVRDQIAEKRDPGMFGSGTILHEMEPMPAELLLEVEFDDTLDEFDETTDSTTLPIRARRIARPMALALAVLLFGLLAGAIGMRRMLDPPREAEETLPVVTVSEEAEPETEEALEAATATPEEVEPPVSSRKTATAVPAPPPKAAPVAPPAADGAADVMPSSPEEVPVDAVEPPLLTAGVVALDGDASAVELVAGEERYPIPGEVPAGRYTIEATFGDEVVPSGTVVVTEGSAVRVVCNSLFARCTVR